MLERGEKKFGYSLAAIGLALLLISISALASQGALAPVDPLTYRPNSSTIFIAALGAIGLFLITGGLAFSGSVLFWLAIGLFFMFAVIAYSLKSFAMLFIAVGGGFGWWLGLLISDVIYRALKSKNINKQKETKEDEDYYWCRADLVEDCLLRVAKYADDIEDALSSFMAGGSIGKAREVFSTLSRHSCPFECSRWTDSVRSYPELDPVKWVKDLYDSLYLNDIERMSSLVRKAREFLSSDYNRRKLIIDTNDNDFYLRLLEYHYLLANTVLMKYSAHAQTATGIGISAVASGGWDNVLFEGSCSFKFGGVSQWRDGVIRVTGAGVELEGKLKVRSMNLTALAIKAAARAAGVGEVSERIPYSDISSYDYDSKKVVINAYGKKYVIKTPAASRIGSLLDELVKGQ